MTLFTSTFFSCWGALLDDYKHSRDKAVICLFEDFTLLQKGDVYSLLKGLLKDNINLDDPDVRLEMDKWIGRAGFFSEELWFNFWSQSKLNDKKELLEFLHYAERCANIRIDGMLKDI